jgi:hypothetical protein
MVRIPVPDIVQSSPPVRAKVVEAFVLPMAMVSAAVPSVDILIVSVPEEVTPPISIVFVAVESARFKVVAAPPRESVVTVALNKVAVVVVEVMSAEVAAFTAKSPLMVVSSDSVMAEDPESIVIFPVVDPPRVSVWALVVERVPVPER